MLKRSVLLKKRLKTLLKALMKKLLHQLLTVLLGLCLSAMSLTVVANEQSKLSKQKSDAKLEVGIGAFAVQLPQYLGSDQSDSYLVPLPYFYYLDENLS